MEYGNSSFDAAGFWLPQQPLSADVEGFSNLGLEDSDLGCSHREVIALREQNARAKVQINAANARLFAVEEAIEAAQLHRHWIGESNAVEFEAQSDGDNVIINDSSHCSYDIEGVTGAIRNRCIENNEEDPVELSTLVLQQGARLGMLEKELNEALVREMGLRSELKTAIAAAATEASLRSTIEGELRQARLECAEVVCDHGATRGESAGSNRGHQEQVIIMTTSTSMGKLEMEMPVTESICSSNMPALQMVPTHLPRPVLTGPAVPLRQLSAGTAGSTVRQPIPTNCSSLPAFHRVGSEVRHGMTQGLADCGGAGAVSCGQNDSIAVATSPLPPHSVFRRWSGKGGMQSPRLTDAGSFSSNLVNTHTGSVLVTAPPRQAPQQQSAGSVVQPAPHYMGVAGAAASRASVGGPTGPMMVATPPPPPAERATAAQGRVTPQRLQFGPAGHNREPWWGYQSSAQLVIPPGMGPGRAMPT